jgi:hypothetical protein
MVGRIPVEEAEVATVLLSDHDVESYLRRLRPRDADFVEYDVADPAQAVPALARLSPYQRLVGAAAAGPALLSALRASFGYDPPAWGVVEYLRGPFPPDVSIPAVPPDLLDAVRQLALGAPGDPVHHGLFPSRATKLARLCLARWGEYPAGTVRLAARGAYGPDRSHRNRSYHAHDALASALAHPGVDADDLAERYARHGARDRGWRSRRKTHAVLAWARRHGHLHDPTSCACGHDRLDRPANRRAAFAVAGHWNTIGPLLVTVAEDADRWLRVLRCTRCDRFWAEDSISSGHATLFFGYPLDAGDPHAWLAGTEPLDLPP